MLLLNAGGAEGTLEWRTQIQINSMYSFRAALLSSGKSRSRKLQEQVPEEPWSSVTESKRTCLGQVSFKKEEVVHQTQHWISDRSDCTAHNWQKHKKPVSARNYILMHETWYRYCCTVHNTHSITWTWYIECEYRFPVVRFQLVRKDDWKWIDRRKHDENVVIDALFGRLVWYLPIVVFPPTVCYSRR